jgi:hypothetical protein
VLVVTDQSCPQAPTTCLVGYNDQTGAKVWQLPSSAVCGVTNSQMLLFVNSDLAVIDLKTGKQLSYVPFGGDQCPTVLPYGLTVSSGGVDGGGQVVTVTQTLQP